MQDEYLVYMEGRFARYSVYDLCSKISLPTRISDFGNDGSWTDVWSARLSTGLFGLTNCVPGNSGPKGPSEVVLGVGDEGVNRLIDLGFITCPTCKPENVVGFWDKVKDAVIDRYKLDTVEKFVDKSLLNFDARRVAWEELVPIMGSTPNRLYVPKNLERKELEELRERFSKMGMSLPPTGFYDAEVEGRFREY